MGTSKYAICVVMTPSVDQRSGVMYESHSRYDGICAPGTVTPAKRPSTWLMSAVTSVALAALGSRKVSACPVNVMQSVCSRCSAQ